MLTAHFSEAELACKCGCGKADMDRGFLEKLEALRVQWNAPIIITSGFRCNNYNAKVKGAKSSQHLLGKAVDIAVAEADKRYRLVSIAQSLGFKGVGIDGSFVHVDTRDSAAVMWLYPIKGE